MRNDPRTIRAWTLYDWANSAYSLTIASAVFPAFYVGVTTASDGADLVLERYGVRAASAYPWALSLGFLVVALIAPLLSGIADSRGNKKSFLRFFCYLGASACAALAFFSLDHIWLGLSCAALACIGFCGSLVFYDAYLPEIATRDQQDRISAKGFVMGYIGSVLLLVLNLGMIMYSNKLGIPESVKLFGREWGGVPARIAFITVALWWAGWAQIPFARLPEGKAEPEQEGSLADGYRALRSVWRELVRTRRLKRYLLAYFVLNAGVQTVMYLAANFAKQEVFETLPDGSTAAISDAALIGAILLIQLVAIVGAHLFVRFSERIGNVRTLMVGALVWIGACAFAFGLHGVQAFYALAAVVGLVMGGTQSLCRSTWSKFIPRQDGSASYFSFYDVAYYLGTVLGTAAYGTVYALTGDLRWTVAAIATFFVLGFVLLARVPKEEVGPSELDLDEIRGPQG